MGLTPAEQERVDALGLRFMLDLRARGEVAMGADYVPQGAEHLGVPGMYDESGAEVDFSPANFGRLAELFVQMENVMTSLYVGMLRKNPATHALVERFAARQAPLFFHCTAGKDRTGVCAALLLAMLGASDDDIVAEYLLTNSYRQRIMDNPPANLPPDIPSADAWREANGVSEPVMRATLAAMGESAAERASYFAEEFGLTEDDLAELRDFYLE